MLQSGFARSWPANNYLVRRAIALLLVALATTAEAVVLSNQEPAQDTYVSQNSSSSKFGANQFLFLGDIADANGILVQYDLTAVPIGSVVSTATLSFQRAFTDHTGDWVLQLRRHLGSWVESNATWNSTDPFSDLIVGPATINPSLNFPTITDGALLEIVQEWVSNPESNFGLMILPAVLDGTTTSFHSKESSTGSPVRLSISYLGPPEIQVTPTSQGFGSVNVGEKTSKSFTVSNTGESLLQGQASVASPFHIVNGADYSLTEGQSASLVIEFRPMAIAGYADQVFFTGGGDFSASITGTGTVAVPGAPSNLAGVGIDDRITLTWSDNSENETGFRMERRTPSGAWSTLATLAPNSETYIDTVLACGTEWKYRVLAFNDLWDSSPSGEASALVPCMDPVAWYSFDTPGEPGNDLINGHDATAISNVSQEPGVIGQAGVFAAGYMQLPGSADFALLSGDFSLSAFVRSADGTNRNWFTKASSSQHRYGLGGSDKVGFGFNGGGGGGVTSASSIFDGEWHHVAAVKRGLSAELWVDGILEDSAVVDVDFTDDGAFAIGRDGLCCEWFIGTLDEAKIWRRALSGSEIAEELLQLQAVAEFTWSPLAPLVGETVQFVDQSTNFPSDWSWDFDGDGLADSTEPNPAHSFLAHGNLVVTLTVANAAGTDTKTHTVNILAVPAPPNAPTSLSVSPAGPFQLDLQWSDNSTNEDGFQVERQRGNTGSWAPVTSVSTGVTSYSDISLQPCESYGYRVWAFNVSGDSSKTNEARSSTICPNVALPFADTFEDGDSSNWQDWVSGWFESGGTYNGTNLGANIRTESVFAGGFNWDDYQVEADLTPMGTYAPADAQLLLRYQNDLDHVSCRLHQDPQQRTFRLTSVVGGEAWVPFEYQSGETYRLKGTALGSTITCEVLGYPETRLFIDHPAGSTGTVGFRNTHISAAFDNLSVLPLVATIPIFTSPTPGSTLPSGPVEFSWSTQGLAITEWWFYLGSTPGAADLHNSGSLGLSENTTVVGLPEHGRVMHGRLWYKISGDWGFVDAMYTAAGEFAVPAMTSPADGATLPGSTTTFTWDPQLVSVDEWWLYLGSAPGNKDVHDSGSLGLAQQTTIQGLPTDGLPVYARLWFKVFETWEFLDLMYTAAAPLVSAEIQVGDTGMNEDSFGVYVDEVLQAQTPTGGRTSFTIILGAGLHVLRVECVESVGPDCGHTIDLLQHITFLDGTTHLESTVGVNQSIAYDFLVAAP